MDIFYDKITQKHELTVKEIIIKILYFENEMKQGEIADFWDQKFLYFFEFS